MNSVIEHALASGEFLVTCEVIPGRGVFGGDVDAALKTACELYATGRIHAVSVTDLPGGNPAFLADAFAVELKQRDVPALVHFTCKDRTRNQIIAQLYALQRQGLNDVLFMSGDCQVSGWSGVSRAVFDLDSVQIQLLARQMNEGLPVDVHGKATLEEPTHIFAGGVVNPYKYRMGEIIPQYLKARKKVAAGARYLIAQLGYDTRKLAELMRWLSEAGCSVPVIANVFILTRGTAQLIQNGVIAGCYVNDELMAKLEEEAAAPDKGKAARIERAAKMVAIAKGLRCSGVHIGGFGLDAPTLVQVLDRAEELLPAWRTCAQEITYGKPGGDYLYKPDNSQVRHRRAGESEDAVSACADTPCSGSLTTASGEGRPSPVRDDGDSQVRHPEQRSVVVPSASPKDPAQNASQSDALASLQAAPHENAAGRKLFKRYGLSRFFHYWMLTLGKRGGRLLERRMDAKERKYGGPDFPHGLEHASKALLYGCIDCGDCGLEACNYSCPMASCPKGQRNGPCGGSIDGYCEAAPGKHFCIWYLAYHRALKSGDLAHLGDFITPPNDWSLRHTSAWSNYTHQRDNIANRIPIEELVGKVETHSRHRRAGESEDAVSACADTPCSGSLTAASGEDRPSPVRDDGDSQIRHPEQRSVVLPSASPKDPAQNASRSDAHTSGVDSQ